MRFTCTQPRKGRYSIHLAPLHRSQFDTHLGVPVSVRLKRTKNDRAGMHPRTPNEWPGRADVMFRWAPIFCLLLPAVAQAKEPFRFPAAKSGKAELKYVNRV